MMWVTPVTDRTEKDILNGTPKGYCNAADLNRLEGNCGCVAELLGLAIRVRGREWDREQLPLQSELERLAGNLRLIRARYTPYLDTPEAPEGRLNHWRQWNDGEQILLDCYRNIEDNKQSRSYCGERIGVI